MMHYPAAADPALLVVLTDLSVLLPLELPSLSSSILHVGFETKPTCHRCISIYQNYTCTVHVVCAVSMHKQKTD